MIVSGGDVFETMRSKIDIAGSHDKVFILAQNDPVVAVFIVSKKELGAGAATTS